MRLILGGQGNDDLLIVGRPMKVFLAVPLRDDWRGIDRSILQWIGHLSAAKHRVVSHVEEPTEPVEYARNVIAGKFLRSDCDALLMIDQDQRPQSSAVRLLDHPADITAGLTFMARNIGDGSSRRRGLVIPAMRMRPDGGPLGAIPHDLVGQQDVDTVGFGAVLIKRRVLEDQRLWLPREYADPYTGETRTLDADDAPPIFRTVRKPNGKTHSGEDFDFCLRARALGYSIAVQMDARFGHVKATDLLTIADMGDSDAQQPSGFVLCGMQEMGG